VNDQTSDKLRQYADNTFLLLFSRLAMAATPVVAVVLVTLGTAYLDARFSAQATAISALDRRINNVELAQNTGQQGVAHVQGQVDLANQAITNTTSNTLAFQNATTTKLDKIESALTQLSTQVSALNATVTAMQRGN
jgi:prefoldin subunit 5